MVAGINIFNVSIGDPIIQVSTFVEYAYKE